MVSTVRYEVSRGDVVSECFDGEFVVLDLSCGKYFSFTDSGSILWEAISAGVSPAALMGAGPDGEAASEIAEFLGKLTDHNLVTEQRDVPPVEPAAELQERLAATTEKPDVLVFDDLADLFLADPIHDVDEEVGWPEGRSA